MAPRPGRGDTNPGNLSDDLRVTRTAAAWQKGRSWTSKPFIWRALRREALPVENGGVATRAFIRVEDGVRSLPLCARNEVADEVHNVASEVETSVLELARTVNQLADNPTLIAFAPAREWDRSGRCFGDSTQARTRLGFVAATPFREGLAQTVAWICANRDRIRCCIQQHAASLLEVSQWACGNSIS